MNTIDELKKLYNRGDAQIGGKIPIETTIQIHIAESTSRIADAREGLSGDMKRVVREGDHGIYYLAVKDE